MYFNFINYHDKFRLYSYILLSEFNSNVQWIAIIACGCCIFQISPGSSSPRLSDTQIFPSFLRTVSSDAEIVVGIVQAMKEFRWSRIALITQTENIFTSVSKYM